MIKIRISDIDEIADQRPPGYREGLLAIAVNRTDHYIEVEPAAYNDLWNKYRTPMPDIKSIESLHHYFDRVVVINLDRRPDRLEEFHTELKRVNWPFIKPTRFRAVDASKLPQHIGWVAGHGAWGCMQSHRQVLQEALMDDVGSILVLEDDVVFADNFDTRIMSFLQGVPSDWDQLMIGGQFLSRDGRHHFSARVAPGVLRVGGCERTHAYALRGRGIRDLYSKWCGAVGHCDHVMGPWQHDFNVYAPDPFLAGQREGKSDISEANNAAKFWIPPRKDAPVYLLRGPVHVMEAIRGKGFHGGRMRTDGIDNGLRAIAASQEGLSSQVQRLKNWVSLIQWEGRSLSPECDAIIFHPDLDERLVRLAVGKSLRVVEARTASEFFSKTK